MINCQLCDYCTHKAVCGKKETIEKFGERVQKITITMNDHRIWRAADCSDVSIDLKCNYYEKNQPKIRELNPDGLQKDL